MSSSELIVKPAEPEKKKKKKISATAKGLAGGISGAIETMFVWPLESVKTKLQLQRRAAAKVGGQAGPPPFTGMLSCFRYTYQTTGFFSFYHGMTPVILGSVPKAALRFGLFERINQLLASPNGKNNGLNALLAGGVAGAIESLLVVTPVETIKTKLIDLKMGSVPGTLHIVRTDGLRGIYRGAVPTTLKQASNQGLRFMAFDFYRTFVNKFRNVSPNQSLDAPTSLIGGMFAGAFSSILNNPFDAVKTRMQGVDGAKLYNGFFDCMTKVVKQEGVSRLWAGVVPRMARVVPGQGIIFASSETISQWVSDTLEI